MNRTAADFGERKEGSKVVVAVALDTLEVVMVVVVVVVGRTRRALLGVSCTVGAGVARMELDVSVEEEEEEEVFKSGWGGCKVNRSDVANSFGPGRLKPITRSEDLEEVEVVHSNAF